MRTIIGKFFKRKRGSAFIEFALVTPILVVLLGAIYDLGTIMLLKNKLIRLSATVANSVAMQNLTSSTLNAIMNNANAITTPFSFSQSGTIITTQIRQNENSSSSTAMLISWQQAIGSTPSKLGSPGMAPAVNNLPTPITLQTGQSVIVVEAFYTYTPIFLSSLFGTQNLYEVSTFVPRKGNMNTLLTQP